jgi:hypothetical protein
MYEWNFNVLQIPYNFVQVFQITLFVNSSTLRIYINDENFPTLEISEKINRSNLDVWTWNNVSYVRIELLNSVTTNENNKYNNLIMGVYYQFN